MEFVIFFLFKNWINEICATSILCKLQLVSYYNQNKNAHVAQAHGWITTKRQPRFWITITRLNHMVELLLQGTTKWLNYYYRAQPNGWITTAGHNHVVELQQEVGLHNWMMIIIEVK